MLLCLKIVIQVKISCEVISIILLHLYLQSKPTQNFKNLWSWTKLTSFNNYWYNLVQAHWSLYLDGRNTSKVSSNVWKDHSRSECTLTDYYLLVYAQRAITGQEAICDALLVLMRVFSLDVEEVNELMNVVLSSIATAATWDAGGPHSCFFYIMLVICQMSCSLAVDCLSLCRASKAK